jgi:serine/threonine protein kinase
MSLFVAASRLPEAERDAFLEEACEDDADLLAEIRRLLAAEQSVRDDGFLEPGELNLAALTPEPVAEFDDDLGEQIGPYQLLRKIGTGGMGTVYQAVRREPYQQVVALKLVKSGFDNELIEERFVNERQTLAGLTHPNIARLLDGGTAGDGRPYLVMEYVEGDRIDESCDKRRLDLRGRLDLFAQVCDAVGFAHDRIVVHRDIKPANVLVSQDGAPKLLDFGLARVLSPELGFAPAESAEAEQSFMTLSYASPEQVLDGTVGKPSDVYSLGIVLYELLTGQRPFHLQGLTRPEARRIVAYKMPIRPAHAVHRSYRLRLEDGTTREVTPESIAKSRHTTVADLSRDLRGDLERILLMALRKEPRDRYADANEMARDLRRYLRNEPVRAQHQSPLYLVQKFVLRNRLVVIGAAVLFAVLTLGLTGTGLALVVARARRLEEIAIEQRNRSLSKKLAGIALFELVPDPELELLLAVNAYEYGATPIAGFALRETLRRTRAGTRRGLATLAGGAAASPDGSLVASIGGSMPARLWEAASGKPRFDLVEGDERVRSVAFSADGQFVLTAAADGAARIWETATGDLVAKLQVSDTPLRSAMATADSTWVVVTEESGACWLWTRGRVDPLGTQPVAEAQWVSADGALRLVPDADGTATLEDVTGGRMTLRGHWGVVRDAVFSADGERVVTGSDDSSVRVWSVRTGEPLQVLRGHDGPVLHVAISTNDRWIASAAAGGLVRVWDIETGALLRSQDGIGALFTTDGEWLVIARRTSTPVILGWEMFAPVDYLLEQARQRVTRELTAEERERYLRDLSEDEQRLMLEQLTTPGE